MVDALLDYLKSTTDFSNAYYRALEYVRENINPYCDCLKLDKNTNERIMFPITSDNLYCLGLDVKTLTIWVYFDEYLADASL